MASWMTGPDQRSPGKAARKLYRVWNKHIWLVLNSDPKKRTRLRNRVAIGMQDRHPNAQFQGPRIQCLVFLMFHPIPGKQTTPTYERDGHFEDLRSTSYMANLHHQLWPMIETYRSSLSFKHSKHYLEPCYDTSWGYSLNQKTMRIWMIQKSNRQNTWQMASRSGRRSRYHIGMEQVPACMC